ncbi:hypothetical protein AB0950_36680, partial [Streptomyces sp. NPDC007189]|uniref:hypothetical protein n=1 Tax=Streptomyces sp. NPDC007189 TaxID=3154315 RepID=UPI003455CD1A
GYLRGAGTARGSPSGQDHKPGFRDSTNPGSAHVVFMEGPSEMGTAAQAATGALVPYFGAIIDWLHAVDNETETPQHRAEQDRTHSEAYGKLLEFLYAAADTTLPGIQDW